MKKTRVATVSALALALAVGTVGPANAVPIPLGEVCYGGAVYTMIWTGPSGGSVTHKHYNGGAVASKQFFLNPSQSKITRYSKGWWHVDSTGLVTSASVWMTDVYCGS